MKSIPQIFACLFSVALLVACAATETETLKQARAEQNDLLKEVHVLDSTVSEYANRLNGDISALGMDSTLATDSSKMKSYTALKDRFNVITTLQSEMMDWKNELKRLPSVEAMADGAENPFGENATDQDVLTSVRASREQFKILKARVEEAMVTAEADTAVTQ